MEGKTIHWQNRSGTSGTASITSASPVASAVPARVAADAGPERRTRVAAPAAPRGKPASTDGRPQASTESAPAAAPAYRVANVARDDVLNIRGGPSADDEIVGALEAEQQGIRLAGECRERWCPITHGDVNGWVNAAFLVAESAVGMARPARLGGAVARDVPDAPRTCLTEPARALLDTIETHFGPVRVISTCRPGATIAGTGRPSRHASGNAVDFDAGSRKNEIVTWLVANHKAGGTMTYADMDHIHIDIGRHFVSLAGNRMRTSGHSDEKTWPPERMGLSGTRVR